MLKKILISTCLAIFSTSGYADVGDSSFVTQGTLQLDKYKHVGFVVSTLDNLRVNNYNPNFMLSNTSTPKRNDFLYSYSIRFRLPEREHTLQLRAKNGYTCLIEFALISPNEAHFEVTNTPGVRCGIDKEGNISYMSYARN